MQIKAALEDQTEYSDEEMMAVAAARSLRGKRVCFVGIGIPSTAANLARRVHEPNLVLIYESGAIGARPTHLPLSIGDEILAVTAQSVVSVPEIFNYWLQPGRIDVGFLSAAQLDRRGNINTTFIGGSYARPQVRLPGAGGAPEIAASCQEVIVVVPHRRRIFVDVLDFTTSLGHGTTPDHRQKLGLLGRGPTLVITDLGVLEPDPVTRELTLSSIHPGIELARVRDETGWPLAERSNIKETEPPTQQELAALRALTRTEAP
jgi:glutaconate CoA-transferase subunit B